jgi:SnoaL-like domain
MTHSNDIEQLIRFFEQIKPADLAHLGEYYAPDARFKDPFNEVQGITAICAVFEHMFENLQEPRFVITECVQQGSRCFLTWDFVFRFQRFRPEVVQTIHGVTYLAFDQRGLVSLHRDYWDAAEELYEKLPWVGGLMRWLKRRSRS